MQSVLRSEIAQHAYQALIAAGELACSLQHKSNVRHAKVGRDFATEADIAVQQQLIAALTKQLPGLHILGEEDKCHEIDAEDFLVVDPIDGTFLYSAGSDAWGITLALISQGAPRCGFLYQPARQQMIYAESGHGCYLNGERIRFAPATPLSESIIGLAQGCWNTEDELHQVNVPLSCAALFSLCPGSTVDAGFEMIHGVCSAYLNYRGKIWDFAGLAIAVQEAGGVVSAPSGAPRSWDALSVPCLFASSAEIQKEIIDLLPSAYKIS